MERLLITKADFAGYRTLSSKIDQTTQLDPFILEAQRLDLLQMLGNSLYFKLLTVINQYYTNLGAFTPTTETPEYIPTEEESDYLLLLNGGNYTDKNNIVREYLGLKPVLVYLTFARYVRQAHIGSTESGFRKMQNQYSEPITRQEINDMVVSATNDAQAFMSFVRDFMAHHDTKYNLGGNTTCDDKGRLDPKRTRLTAIRSGSVIGRKYSRG